MIPFDAFLDLARSRRSTRLFAPGGISREVLERLVDAARWAPSAGNLQDWGFTAVRSRVVIERMAGAVRRRWEELLSGLGEASGAAELRSYAENFLWFERAPAVVAVSAKRTETFLNHVLGDRAQAVSGRALSAAMAAQNLMLAAQTEGLATCCLTGPIAAEEELKELLGLDRRQSLVCLIAVGFPAEPPLGVPRKPVDRILRFIDDPC